jgi:D-alanine--D-alanine ligase
MEKKIRVAVLFGGNSNEKEISLESGRNVVYKLSPSKYDVLPVFLTSKLEPYIINNRLLVHNSTKEIEHDLEPSMRIGWSKLPELADFVFIGLHGGAGENGSVQGALEMLGLPYNGSSIFSSALCMDKYKTNQFLHAKGIAVPKGILVSKEDWTINQSAVFKKISSQLSFPLIIKPHDDGCSVLVQKVRNNDELASALIALFARKNFALAEECIFGMELTVGVVGNKNPHALPPSKAVAQKDILSMEEKFLPGAGENQTPAPLPPETLALVQDVVVQTYKAAQCSGYARIDCFYQNDVQSPTGKERVVILEINSLPALTPATVIFHQAAELGMRPMDFIDMIVSLGFAAHDTTTATAASLHEQAILEKVRPHAHTPHTGTQQNG